MTFDAPFKGAFSTLEDKCVHQYSLEARLKPFHLLLALSVVFFSCSKTEKKKKRSKKETVKSVLVQECDPNTNPVQTVYKSLATYKMAAMVSLQTEVNGVVLDASFRLKPGQRFNKGAVLFNVDSRQAKINYQKATSELIRTLALALPQIGQDMPEVAEKWKGYYDKLNDNNLPNLPNWQEGRSKAMISILGIPAAYLKAKEAKLFLSKHKIRAPFSGEILSSMITKGQLIRANTVLAELIPTRGQELETTISVNDISLFPVGSKGVAVRGNDSIAIEIFRIGSQIQKNSSRVSVFLKTSSKNDLRSGEIVSIELLGKKLLKACSVPLVAVQNEKIWSVEKGVLVSVPWTEIRIQENQSVGVLDKKRQVVIQEIRNGISGTPVKPVLSGE